MKYLSKSVKHGRTYYRIRKNYDGREYHVFQSPNKEVTLRVYNECRQADWKKEQVLSIMQHYKEHRPVHYDMQYITQDDKGGWRVQRWTQGRVRYYGKSRHLPEAMKIRDYLVEHGWKRPVLHKKCVSPNKYLKRLDNGKYRIIKYGGGYYGTYDSYDEAVLMRNRLIENNWNKELITYKRGHDNPDRYISIQEYKGKKHYHVNKLVNSQNIHFATCKSLEEARSERDFWESINWDFDLLDLH